LNLYPKRRRKLNHEEAYEVFGATEKAKMHGNGKIMQKTKLKIIITKPKTSEPFDLGEMLFVKDGVVSRWNGKKGKVEILGKEFHEGV
jgi:hypothetical protein